MERGPKRHRVDRQEPFVSEHEDDHLEEVPSGIGPNREQLWWITVWIEVDDHERMIARVADRIVTNSVPPSGPMDFHTVLV